MMGEAAKLRRKLEAYHREEERQWMKGCVVVTEPKALSKPDRKKLERLGAVVIQKAAAARSVHFMWPPDGGR